MTSQRTQELIDRMSKALAETRKLMEEFLEVVKVCRKTTQGASADADVGNPSGNV